MRKICILFLLVVFNISVALAVQTKVSSLRINSTKDKTRLVFDVSRIPEHTIFHLQNPERLVIDFKNTYIEQSLLQPLNKHPLLTALREANRNKKDFRVVFGLQERIMANGFTLAANKKSGPRIVIDLPNKQKKRVAKQRTANNSKAIKTVSRKVKPFIVAVDAGHGGKDSGAIGQKGTLEKQVVLQIAKKLTNLINQQPGMKAIMVRKGDIFVPLRKRMQIARKANADLFVSIHADAFENSNVTGASVFTLSSRSADKEAKQWLKLAKHENAVDLIGGISLNDKDNLLASILLDLSQAASLDISQLVARDVLRNISQIGELHSKTVQEAGFIVLKSPDIPSILVETAFISNPKEERRLKSAKYQLKIAKAIHQGIASYAQKHTVALNTMMLDVPSHKVSRGETLLGIALKYGITLDQLKRANRLTKENNIKTGQMLSIPVGI